MFTWLLSLILFTNQIDIIYSCLDAACSTCYGEGTGDFLSQSPYQYYRREEMVFDTCATLCLKDEECKAIEQHDNKCYKVELQFEAGRSTPITQGKVYIKNNVCIEEAAVKNPLPLYRLRREWRKYNHTWGIPTEGRLEHSGLCYAVNDTSSCLLMKFGVSKDGKKISTDKYDRFLGYCGGSYAECGATETVDEWKHTNRKDFLYLPTGHPDHLAIGLGFEEKNVLPCYFWPGFWNLNCDKVYEN